MALTHVLTPIKLGHTSVKNRIVRSAHGTNLGEGIVGRDLAAYHLERARGGVGLSFIEILSVHPSTPMTLNIFQHGIGDSYRQLVDQVAPTGMKLFQQLWHGGHNALPLDGGAPWSASDIPGPLHPVVPIPMTQLMIDDIVAAFADAARRCEAWGLDGVEVHAAHGYLVQQFLSPNTNRRGDGYGGTLTNRARFLVEILTAIRKSVKAGFPVGVRVAPDTLVNGIGVDDNIRVIGMLEELGLVDFIDISLGNYQSFPKMIGGMHEAVGYEMDTSAPIARASRAPAIVTGRFRTLEEADLVIRAGDAAMVSLVRAHIADPRLVEKTMAGHAEQVRPCIGCNQGCLGNELQPPFRLECVVNPGTGFELTVGDHLIQAATVPRRVLVVGGGPAGMEAARVAALRGHRVVLTEAEANLGGALKAARLAPTRHGIGDFAVWLEHEIYRLGVQVRLSTFVEAEDVLAERWDAVIIAAGSRPRMDGMQLCSPGERISGMDLPHVLSSSEVLLEPKRATGATAVVIDDVGHYEAIGTAEALIARGIAVTFITRLPSLGPLVQTSMMVEPALERLQKGRFSLHTHSRAHTIDRHQVIFASTCAPPGHRRSSAPADIVVFVSYNRPNRELVVELGARHADVRIVGDANTPRFLQSAVREGHLAAMAV